MIAVVRQLDDGNWLLRVNGEERQTITLEQKRQALTTLNDRKVMAEQIEIYKEQVRLLERIKASDEKITANLENENKRLEEMLQRTSDLLFKAMENAEQFRAVAKTSKFVALLNSPYIRLAMTLAPIAASVVAK